MVERFGCGCIGIKFNDDDVLLLKECCEGEICFCLVHKHIQIRNFNNDYLNQDELKSLSNEIGWLINDGKKFREIKSLLGG